MTSLAQRQRAYETRRSIHRGFRQDSIKITDPTLLKPVLYPWMPSAYYVLLYKHLLASSGVKSVAATLSDSDRHTLANAALDELGVYETDERLNDWMRECSSTSRSCCANNARIKHAVRSERAAEDFTLTPNAYHLSHIEPVFLERELEFCICAAQDTIMLCNNLAHTHCAEAKRALFREPVHTDEFRDRLISGRYNQNVVSLGAFGWHGNRDRWLRLRICLNQLTSPSHSCEMTNELDDALRGRAELVGLRYCLASFSYANNSEEALGKRGDRDFSLLPHTKHRLVMNRSIAPFSQTVRDAEYLDLAHPHHARIDVRRAVQVTLGLLLFVDATGSSLWQQAWKLWCGIVLTHCRGCVQNCHASMCESLSFVMMCGCLMRPGDGMSRTLLQRVEQLLQALIEQKPQFG